VRRFSIRDAAVILAAMIGLHALLVALPARLARPEPSMRVLPLTAPDCATLLRSPLIPAAGGLHAGAGGGAAPAAPAGR
jgi:hypothetical protein